jgi:phage terminase large subunit
MIKTIQATRIYEQTVEAAKNYKIICHKGGSRSSKTWSIIQFLLGEAIQGKKYSFTIVRDKLSWIKGTVLKDFQDIADLMEIKVIPSVNPKRQDQVYNINGSEFAFFGLDYAEKLHGRRQDWFWMNEVLEVHNKSHFDQLEMRTDIGGILDFNPYDDRHWVYDLEKRNDVIFIKSTMLDNPFLPESIINKIKSYEPTDTNIQQGTADNYMWEVYGLGNKARLQGTVFSNWDTVDSVPENARFIGYGQDFGFSNDPTALVGVYMMDNELYIDQLLYKVGLTNDDIVSEYKQLNIRNVDEIYADSAEPKSIEEIRRRGFNIRGAKKGSDSIMYGIDLLKGYKLHITKRSIDLESELRRYKYQEDKSGRIINKPVDAYNHAIDALRYLAIMKLGTQPKLQSFSRRGLGI